MDPRDRAVGLHDTSLSPATPRMVGRAAASVSFVEASEWMRVLAGVAVDPKQVARTAEAPTELPAHSETCEEARKCIDYLTRNRHRMRYPEFRAAGLCVSSGVVEAGCKHAVGAPFKRAGMHWTVAGANAIMALRCCKLSGRFEDFGERRTAKSVTVISRI